MNLKKTLIYASLALLFLSSSYALIAMTKELGIMVAGDNARIATQAELIAKHRDYQTLRLAFGHGNQIIDQEEFLEALNIYKNTTLEQLNIVDSWVGKYEPFSAHDLPFRPFTQKMIVPENSNVCIFGDFHADALSMFNALDALQKDCLDGFNIKKNSQSKSCILIKRKP